MNVLLDTHILLWWLDDSPRLGAAARMRISNPAQRVFISSASLWEIRIKHKLGKLALPANFDEALDRSAFNWLSITRHHASATAELAPHHRDPFDRMLVAQAQCEGLTLLTADDRLAAYGPNVLYVAAMPA